MGIAISNSQYVSALNPSLGTLVGPIPSGTFFFYRLNATLRGVH
jgi:hypothetical protein